MKNMKAMKILSVAHKARTDEVLTYQINIDNYRRAITLAAADPELGEFVKQLQQLLASSLLEQKKAKVMLAVIDAQLGSPVRHRVLGSIRRIIK